MVNVEFVLSALPSAVISVIWFLLIDNVDNVDTELMHSEVNNNYLC